MLMDVRSHHASDKHRRVNLARNRVQMDATVRQTAEDAIARVGHQQGVDTAFSGSRFVDLSRTTNVLENTVEEEVLRNPLYKAVPA